MEMFSSRTIMNSKLSAPNYNLRFLHYLSYGDNIINDNNEKTNQHMPTILDL